MTGIGNWMKVLGDPVDNFAKDGKEWTFDFTPDADGLKTLKGVKLAGRIKNKDDDRGDFMAFKQKATRRDGSPNRPITIVDARNRKWPEDQKIGNGSKIEVKFSVKEYGAGIQAGVYPQAIRILEHVPYERQEFAPLPEESEYVQHAPDFAKDFGLDDDFPE